MSSEHAKPGSSEAIASSTAAGPASRSATPNARAGDALEAGLEATVAAYLRRHPDFFDRNPEVLAEIQVAHGPGGVVSLIEHQVKVLRRQLDTERGRLAHLITRAREYESLASRLHDLVVQIIPVADLGALCQVLNDALRREFDAAAVILKLFPLDPAAAPDGDPLSEAFRGFIDRETALCGPLDADKNRILFGDLGSGVSSAALVPIRAEGGSGVLAIGSADADRFKPDMGTELLDRLGEIVSQKLRALGAEPANGDLPCPGSALGEDVDAGSESVDVPDSSDTPAPRFGITADEVPAD
jgi:uncharacterized protein YigA (DUF484 family)